MTVSEEGVISIREFESSISHLVPKIFIFEAEQAHNSF